MALLRLTLPLVSAAQSAARHRRRGTNDPESGRETESDRGTASQLPRIDTDYSDFEDLTPGQDEQEQLKDDDDEVGPKYRYTPLLSGIVIPLCILLEIPGLTEHWYIRTHNNVIVDIRANPVVLDIGLGFSCAFAVLANLCLIGRFLERRITLMTLLCVLFLTLHDIINIIAVTTFGVVHRFNDGFTYGQAFWITVCSTIVSVFTNVNLALDFFRTKDFATSGSGLTSKQRSLVIIVIVLFIYISLGALINSFMLGRTFVEGLYFTVVTIETIGFGDIVPETAGARAWTCVYASFGILILGLAVGTFADTVLEALEATYRRRLAALRARRRAARRAHKMQTRWRTAVVSRLRHKGAAIWVKVPVGHSSHPPGLERSESSGRARLIRFASRTGGGLGVKDIGGAGGGAGGEQAEERMRLNLGALAPHELSSCALEAGVRLDAVKSEWARIDTPRHTPLSKLRAWIPSPSSDQIPFSNVAVPSEKAAVEGGPQPLSSEDPNTLWLDTSYEDFKKSLQKEERRQFYAKVTIAWTQLLIFWFSGSAIFMRTEGWDFGTSMYFSFMTFSTIGYGDFHIETPAGRAVFVVWCLIGVATMTTLISVVSDAFSSRYKSILTKGAFHKAVKRYRVKRRTSGSFSVASNASGVGFLPPPLDALDAQSGNTPGSAPHRARTLPQARERAAELTEALPGEILAHAEAFRAHVRYAIAGAGAGSGVGLGVDGPDSVPEGLKALLDDIAQAEKIGDRVKKEMLMDAEARNTLFILSVEQALRNMIASAERSLEAIAERDRLLADTDAEADDEDDARTASAWTQGEDEPRRSASALLSDRDSSWLPSGEAVTRSTSPAADDD